ncbi:MAG: alanine--tRNA ligase [Clostridiales bacterium]|jgi:alanyl-tRNA synthetase|nr:alanine--tRNA ligase [Clostridiales bacterium]
MQKLTSKELRTKYLKYFKERGHAVLGSASLIPENDPTVLFTTAGMHPLVPYLMGEKHPLGKRLASVQKCVRTVDIDEVGDATHCTFFEMLGNWSLGDYFKKESINFSYGFLTDVLKIPKERLAVSVFSGDSDCERDEESADYWVKEGLSFGQVYFLPKKNNWWGPAGLTGPCGPDTEIFIDTGREKCSPDCSPACGCGKFIEIWNNVFMQYNKTAEGKFEPLSNKNVDTGMGLERTVCILNGLKSVYETDLFSDAVELIRTCAGLKNGGESPDAVRAVRIIADHIRTATFIIGDQNGVSPGNLDRGYVLRRLIRRAVRYARQLSTDASLLAELAELYVEKYAGIYGELTVNGERIISEINKETEKFGRTLSDGLKEFEKVAATAVKAVKGVTANGAAAIASGAINGVNDTAKSGTTGNVDAAVKEEAMTGRLSVAASGAADAAENGTIDGAAAFRLYDTFGFPIEITEELARDRGLGVDRAGFEAAFSEHRQKSQAGAEQKFKGGLHDHSDETTRLHTATHLLQAALREVLGAAVFQRGSNITAERLRFDFSFDRPMTADEIAAVERRVNEVIAQKLDVVIEEMTVESAKKANALGVFESKYGEIVKVYTVGGFSKEICGGPHVKNTGELGVLKIEKEQSSSSGVRRIKATLS